MTAAEVMALIRASEKKFYCYVLHRPDGRPFYVGVGSGRRIVLHEREAEQPGRRGYKVSIIRKVWKSGQTVVYTIQCFDTRDEAAVEEARLIAQYGRKDLGKGPLANRTDGGIGVRGLVWEFTENRQTGVKRAAEKNRGRKLTEEHKAKLSAAGKGRVWRQETRDKRSAALTGRKLSAEHVAAMSEAGKRRDVTPFIEGARQWREQNREEMVAERRERWNKPGVRDRHVEAMADLDRREAMRAAMNARLEDPKKRAILVEAVRAARAHAVVIDGVYYPSMNDASKKTGISRWMIAERLRRLTPGYERVK